MAQYASQICTYYTSKMMDISLKMCKPVEREIDYTINVYHIQILWNIIIFKLLTSTLTSTIHQDQRGNEQHKSLENNK